MSVFVCVFVCLFVLTNSRQPHLVISFLTLVFPSILLHIFPTAVLIVPAAVKVAVISLSFQSSVLLFINLSNSLVVVFAFDAPTVRECSF